MAHVRQSRPDSGLGFLVKVLKRFQAVPFSLGSGCVWSWKEVRLVVFPLLAGNTFIVYRQSPLGPIDPSFQALFGCLKLTFRRHNFNKDTLSSTRPFTPRVTRSVNFMRQLDSSPAGDTFDVAVKRHIPVSSWVRWDEQVPLSYNVLYQ